MKKLVLHIGPPKTASTGLQKFLSESRDTGEYIYPKFGRVKNGVAHHNIAYELRKHDRYEPAETGFFELNKLMRNTKKNVFISSEEFILTRPVLDPIVRISVETGFSLEIVYFVRDPLDRLNSMYTQQVKTGMTFDNFPDFLIIGSEDKRLYPFLRRKQVLQWFPDVEMVLVPFIGRKVGDYFSALCKRYGIEAVPKDFEAINESPSPEEVRFYLENKEIFKGKRFMAWISKAADSYDFKRKFYGFDQPLYEQYRKKFSNEYNRFGEFPFFEIEENDKFKLITQRKPYDGSFDEEKYTRFAKELRARLIAEIGPS